MELIIAEKKSVGKTIAAALGATAAEVVSLAVTALLCLRDGVSLSRAPRPAFGARP